MSLSPGTRLGPYDVVAKLGEGGMGEVYRAHDPRLGRDVALKVLPASMAADRDALARFEREARAIAALNHPHIVTIYSTEEHAGLRFLTMEVVEGRTLGAVIPERGLPLDRFFDIALALADALTAAHQKQITHRDLKPSNIMVANDGRVKVLDFGLARAGGGVASEAATQHGLTAEGTIIGTVPYMSPEQLESRPLDPRSDLFSFGIVAYEMATGRRPFGGDSAAAVMSAILRDQPAPAAAIRPEVPEGVSRLIASCLAKPVSARVQSAQDLLSALRALRREWDTTVVTASATTPAAGVPRPTPAGLRVAVLPLSARGGADAESLAEGLTDDITTGLSRFSYLQVISRHDAEAAGGRSADTGIARALGARFLLDGNVRGDGRAFRVSVRLIDAASGVQVWGQRYERTPGPLSLFEIQDDVASRVAATVGDSAGLLVRAMATSFKDRPLEGLSVTELVLRYFAYTVQLNPVEHGRLRDVFERALAREPDHALGWACLALLLENEYTFGFNLRDRARELGLKAAQRAMDLDASCQAAWRAMAAFHFFDRDLAGLRLAADRTIAINPISPATGHVGLLLALAGEWDRGIPLLRRAIDLNPNHSGWFHLVVALDHYRRGEFADALAQAKLSSVPQLVTMPLIIAAAAGQLGRVVDVRAAFETLRQQHADFLAHERARQVIRFWVWEADLVDALMEGFSKAQGIEG